MNACCGGGQSEGATAALFRSRLGAVPTHDFLRDAELVSTVSALIQSHAQAEVAALERSMTLQCPAGGVDSSLRLAFTNIALDGYAGSELWTLEMAAHMHRLGIPTIVYSPHLGAVARQFAATGLAITDHPVDLQLFKPTVLHIHHHWHTAGARMAVGPNCLCVNMVHGLLPHPEWPGPGMDVYLAVSLHAKAKTALLGPRSWDSIALVPNFFDPERFGKKVAKRRHKALIHSSRVTELNLHQMKFVLRRQELALDHIGYGGTVESTPENVLPRYRVVFAAGRSAIEALASGCHVILWDQGIVGPAVTLNNFWYVLAANFSVASCILPFVMIDDPAMEDWLSEQLSQFEDPAPLRELVHHHLAVGTIGQKLLTNYKSI